MKKTRDWLWSIARDIPEPTGGKVRRLISIMERESEYSVDVMVDVISALWPEHKESFLTVEERSMTDNSPTGVLTREYSAFLKKYDLSSMSADELLIERPDLSPHIRWWLNGFIERWERAEKAERQAYNIIRELTVDEINYAVHSDRGAYRGFPALHDLMDANNLLPPSNDFDYLNMIVDEVTRILLDDEMLADIIITKERRKGA